MSDAKPLPDSPPEALRDEVRKAVIWRSGSQIVGQIITWASTFVVIRILSPSDYGLMAMSSAIMLFLSLVNGYGFANALIQRKQIDQHMLRQLFGMLILVNLVLAALHLLAAPFAVEYYHEPMVARLLWVQVLLYPTTPFIALAYTILSRGLEFKRQGQVNMVSAILAALAAIVGALAGWGVWTLVWAPLVGLYARAIGLTWVARSLMWPSFDFSGAGFIFRFGSLVLIGQLFWFIQTQSDVFIVGRAFSAHELGIYTTALFLTQLFITKVVPPLNEVAFSAYSRLQHHDGEIAPAFLRSIQMIMFAGLPVFVGFAVTARPLVLVVLGEKWIETVPFVALLALAMPLKTMLTLFGPASNAVGRPDVQIRNSLAGAIILPAAFLISLLWGLIGIAYAWIVGNAILLAIAAYWSFPVLGVSWRQVAGAVAPSILASVAMGAAVLATDSMLTAGSPLVRLLILVAVGASVYAGWLMLFARSAVFEMVELILNRRVGNARSSDPTCQGA